MNETTAAITLQLYASDAFTTKTGGFGVAANYKPKHTMGAWIHLPVSRVTIPAKSGDVVPFTYDPPAGVAPGDYTGAIVAEQTSGPVNKQGTLHIQTLDAVGVAVYGRIRGKLVPRLAVTRVSVDTSTSFGSAFGGPVAATVHYSVTNTGNENLKPLLTISVSPLVGSAHKVQVQLPRILAGSTVSLSYRVPSAVPFGALTATVTARAFNASDSGSSGAVVMPWGVVGVLILIAAGLFIRARRRRRRPNKGDPAGSGQPGVGARQSVLA